MSAPKVSVSIVTYNHERFIGECLSSVVSQKTSFPFEIVVGEDCSPDGTAAVIRSYAASHPEIMRPIFHSPNLGVRRNFQSVLDACRGEYIAHLDGDDRMLPGKLQRQADFLDAHPEAVQVFHRVRLFDSNTNATLGEMPRRTEPVPRSVDDVVRHRNAFSSCSQMFRREALPEKGIDPRFNMVIDWYMQIAVGQRGQLGFIDEILGEYRQHGSGAMQTSLAGWERLLRDQLLTIELARGMKVSLDAIEESEARLQAHYADRLLLAGNYAEFTRWIEASAARRTFSRAHALRVRLSRSPRTLRALVRAAIVLHAVRERLRR